MNFEDYALQNIRWLIAGAHFENANDIITPLLKRYPENIDFLVESTFIYEALFDRKAMARNLKQAEKIAHGSAEAFFIRAVIIHNTDSETALNLLNQAIQLKPDFAYAYFYRGCVRKEQNDLAGAANDLSRCVEIRPDHSIALLMDAEIKARMEQYEEALDDMIRYSQLPAFIQKSSMYRIMAHCATKLAIREEKEISARAAERERIIKEAESQNMQMEE